MLQLIEEHCRAFEFNNAIIQGYRVGVLAPVVAAVKLSVGSLSPRSAGSVAVALGALAVAVYFARGWQQRE